MTKPVGRDPIYRCRRFSAETIELCVRWYITYRLSYRDLAEMMAEREVIVAHTTIMRWVQQYVPEYHGLLTSNRFQCHPRLERRRVITSWLSHGYLPSGCHIAPAELHLHPCPKNRNHLSIVEVR